jgi:hypothetical protein
MSVDVDIEWSSDEPRIRQALPCRFLSRSVDNLASRAIEGAAQQVKGAPTVADLTFLVEGILSIAVVTVPIGLILALLVAGDYTVSDLFLAPSWEDRGNGPVPTHDEAAPRWRPERLRPRGKGAGPVPSASPEDATTVQSSAGPLTLDQVDC